MNEAQQRSMSLNNRHRKRMSVISDAIMAVSSYHLCGHRVLNNR
jgi:hypothetical protein